MVKSQLPLAKKHFGQNFLVNQAVIANIVQAIKPQATQNMLEIGPGVGALTQALLPGLDRLNVVELDASLIPRLISNCAAGDKLVIYQQDALQFDLSQVASVQRPLRVVGNLPYNISTPLLFHLLASIDLLLDGHFMLQKEVVDRIVAQPGSKTYGRLSVLLQYFCTVERLFIVKPNAFVPKPKVDSAILRLIPKSHRPLTQVQEINLALLVKQAFAQRRKTLRNNLKALIATEQWNDLRIAPERRAESLTIDDYVYLVQNISFC